VHPQRLEDRPLVVAQKAGTTSRQPTWWYDRVVSQRFPAGEEVDVRRCQSLARAQVTSGGYLKGGGSPLSFSAVQLAETTAVPS
jgi:hypothetical protein